MRTVHVLLAAVAAVVAPTLVALAPLVRSVPIAGRLPAPVDPAGRVRAEGEEERLREGRRLWIDEMHRTPPGVDWRAVERANGLARMEARAAMADGQAPRTAVGWVEVGSRNLAGRMHAAALSVDGDSLYAGSSRGGVWKADKAGNGWRPLGDNLWGGAHSLAVAGPPETVTRLTDDGVLHYTEDGGASWHVPAGTLGNIVEGERLRTDPANPDRVYLMVRKQTVGNVGKLYRSDDGGRSYTRIRSLVAPGDIWIDRVDGGRLWLLEDGTLLHSDDGGASWITDGTLPVSGLSRVLLVGSEAGAPTFYAAVQSGGAWNLYRSTDAGATWSWRHAIDDFWETLGSSIADPDLVLFGGVELWRSVDGGASFTKVNGWGDYYGDPANRLHADLPGLDVLWDGAQEMHLIATDGGLYRSDDAAATVSNLSLAQLRVSQYYDTHTSANDPALVLAGAQDQGYQRSNGGGSGSLLDFDQLISGDYGHLTSSDGTHGWVFSVYPGFVLAQEGELAPSLSTLDFPPGENHSWMPYVLADPDDADSFYFCGNHIVHYRHILSSWIRTPSAQDLTANGGSYTTALAISPLDGDARLTVTNSGLLWFSTDGGTTWTMSADTGPSAHYFYGTALEFSAEAAGEAVVAGSGYGGPAAYRTTDGGATWTAIGDGLPPTLIYDIAYEPSGAGAVHAATENGAYRLDPQTDTWEWLDDADSPLTTYWSVEAVPAAGVMRYGTYGRGIWDYVLASPEVAVAETLPGDDGAFALRGAPNPFRSGTTLRFTLPTRDPATLRVVDAAGRLVREIAVTGGAGERVVRWDGRNEAGRDVAAGIYFARLRTAESESVRRLVKLR